MICNTMRNARLGWREIGRVGPRRGDSSLNQIVALRQRVLIAALMATFFGSASVGNVAAADAPGSCSGATSNSSLNKWISGAISSGSDRDWYRFTTSSSGYAVITLGDLAKNYRLHLYRSDCSKIVGSDRPSTQYEEIVRSLPAGRYYVQVSPKYSSAYSATPYALRFRTLSSGVKVLSKGTAWTDSIGYLHIPGEVLNTTSGTRQYVKITATLYNSANQVLKTDFTYTYLSLVGKGARAGFHLMTEKPIGYHHTSLSVSSSATSATPVGNLAIAAGVPYVDSIDYAHYPGEVTNGNSFSVDYVQVMMTLYNGRGGVINHEFTYTDPSTIAAGDTAPFEVLTDRFGGTNRYTFAVEASR
jgi:hypothetical protein